MPDDLRCLVQNNAIVDGPRTLPAEYNGILNFPLYPTPEQFGWFTVSAAPTFDPKAQKLQPVIGDSVITYEAVALSPDELASALAARQSAMVNQVVAIRTAKLLAGFDYDFHDARGVHHIGTTPDDEAGWDKVSKLATAAMLLGNPTATIDIVTNTAPAQITAAEWQGILIAAGQFEQPLYARSFAMEADIIAPAADQTALDAIDITAGWPS